MTRETLISLVMSAAFGLSLEMGHWNTVTIRAFVRRYEITRRVYRRTCIFMSALMHYVRINVRGVLNAPSAEWDESYECIE